MTAFSDDHAGFEDLAHTLWRQQRLLQLLLVRIEIHQLLLAAGQARWIEQAIADVEAAVDGLGEVELIRVLQLSALAGRLGLTREPTLAELVEVAPEPWQEILRDHHQTLVELIHKVQETSRANHELVQCSLRSMHDLYEAGPSAEGPTNAYGRISTVAARPQPLLLDRKA